MTIQRYWEIILAKCAELDPDTVPAANAAPPGQKHWTFRRSSKVIWLRSLDNEEKNSFAGSVVEANPLVAAEAIYNKTHDRAPDEDVQRELARREQMRQGIIAQDNAQRNPGTTIVVTAEALRAALAGAGLTPKKEEK
jgi:hypothetical protein